MHTETQQQNENMDPNQPIHSLSIQTPTISPEKKRNKQRSHFCEFRFVDPLFFPSDRRTSIKLQLNGVLDICSCNNEN